MDRRTKRYVLLSTIVLTGLFKNQLPAMAAASDYKAVYNLADAGQSASKKIYEFGQDSQYRVETQVGHVTDIELHPGEQVTYIVGGETARWMVDKSIVGTTQHVYVKPLEANIETNLIINTNARCYRILISSGDSYTPVVAWKYSDEEVQDEARKAKLKRQIRPYDSDDPFVDPVVKAKLEEWKDRHSDGPALSSEEDPSSSRTVGRTKNDQPFVINWMKKDGEEKKGKDSGKKSPHLSFRDRIRQVRERDTRNFRYTIRNVKDVPVDLLPLQIWDNGKQTIIKMPKNNKYDLPVIYTVDDSKKLQLVNFRVRDSHIIADRVFRKARLQYSPKKYIEIVPSKDKETDKIREQHERDLRRYVLKD